MAWTKLQFVKAAYEEMGLASYVFDLEPEQLEYAVRRLDAMLAAWNGMGLRLGYSLTTDPDNINLDQDSGLPDWANDAVITNLAVKIAPSVGKQLPMETKQAAKQGMNLLFARSAQPNDVQMTGIPSGAGHKMIYNPFLAPFIDPLLVGQDNQLDF